MRPGKFIGALLLILIGAIAFFANLGYGTWEGWRQLFTFWPVILVIIGLSIFWGGRIPRWLAFCLVIIIIGGVILWAFTDQGVFQ